MLSKSDIIIINFLLQGLKITIIVVLEERAYQTNNSPIDALAAVY